MVSGITDGYLFRKMVSGDRVSEQNSHMVRFWLMLSGLISCSLVRPVISFLKCSETTCWTLGLTHIRMELTHSAAGDASGSTHAAAGDWFAFATGEVGVASSATSQ